ncbi:MAG: hypothetical protein Q8M24_14995 [Pseudolabrys sp.]|nr:hypothetical protein [Pseudolabrys sp.]MDP2296752.1 hypothetical protein [Pseudolabrys sp.]
MISASAIAAFLPRPRPAMAASFALTALAAIALAWPSGAFAQSGTNSLFSAAPSTGLLSPNMGVRGEGFGGGSLVPQQPPPLAAPTPMPMVPAGQVALALSARFGKDASPISGGLTWRVYAAKADPGGAFRMLREEKSAAPTMVLPPGNYIVHVGFGLATAVKPVTLRGPTVREEFDLPAGGLRIEGRVGDVPIPAGQISFDVYKGSQFEAGDRRPIAEHVMTGAVVMVPEGIYYIVSNYGDANSQVRSDIRVQAGKLTDIVVNHRAAMITLKLVNEKGGEALANTAWSVLTPGGDVIKESIGAFPRVVLGEGEYRAIARNEGKVFEREFKVVTGVDGDVEVMAQ